MADGARRGRGARSRGRKCWTESGLIAPRHIRPAERVWRPQYRCVEPVQRCVEQYKLLYGSRRVAVQSTCLRCSTTRVDGSRRRAYAECIAGEKNA
eukprot:927529-Rhodomonas_salina.1